MSFVRRRMYVVQIIRVQRPWVFRLDRHACRAARPWSRILDGSGDCTDAGKTDALPTRLILWSGAAWSPIDRWRDDPKSTFTAKHTQRDAMKI